MPKGMPSTFLREGSSVKGLFDATFALNFWIWPSISVSGICGWQTIA